MPPMSTNGIDETVSHCVLSHGAVDSHADARSIGATAPMTRICNVFISTLLRQHSSSPTRISASFQSSHQHADFMDSTATSAASCPSSGCENSNVDHTSLPSSMPLMLSPQQPVSHPYHPCSTMTCLSGP